MASSGGETAGSDASSSKEKQERTAAEILSKGVRTPPNYLATSPVTEKRMLASKGDGLALWGARREMQWVLHGKHDDGLSSSERTMRNQDRRLNREAQPPRKHFVVNGGLNEAHPLDQFVGVERIERWWDPDESDIEDSDDDGEESKEGKQQQQQGEGRSSRRGKGGRNDAETQRRKKLGQFIEETDSSTLTRPNMDDEETTGAEAKEAKGIEYILAKDFVQQGILRYCLRERHRRAILEARTLQRLSVGCIVLVDTGQQWEMCECLEIEVEEKKSTGFSENEIHLGLHRLPQGDDTGQEATAGSGSGSSTMRRRANQRKIEASGDGEELPKQLRVFVKFCGCDETKDRWIEIGHRTRLLKRIPGRFPWSRQMGSFPKPQDKVSLMVASRAEATLIGNSEMQPIGIAVTSYPQRDATLVKVTRGLMESSYTAMISNRYLEVLSEDEYSQRMLLFEDFSVPPSSPSAMMKK